MISARSSALAVAAALALCAESRAAEVVAVLGSELGPYREAYESLRTAYGSDIEILPLGVKPPRSAKVVVALGGKAALQPYSERVALIYGLAPGLEITPETHDGPIAKIKMEPAAGALIKKLRELQPGLRKLGVVWSSENRTSEIRQLAETSAASGVTVVVERISGSGELPAALRRLKGAVGALWLPPDPLVINARNFETIKQFAYENDVPFYVPTSGLVEKGAPAAVAVSPRETGRAAAAAARAALGGSALPAEIFIDRVEVFINASAAAECGLAIPESAAKAAAKVHP